MKAKIYFLISFLVILSLSIHAQNFQWAKSVGSTTDERGRAITVDASGNTYITGSFGGTADFDPGAGMASLTALGGNDLFIAKYDANGVYQWAKSVGSTNTDGMSIAVDGNGNVYVTGYFYGTVDFDPGAGTTSYTSNGLSDVFITKYDANGNYLWAKSFGSINADTSYDIKIDGNSNIYITGQIEMDTDFDPGPGTAVIVRVGQTDIFFAKYDANGNYIWAKTIGSANSDYGYGIALDGSGNCFITGFFRGTADFNPGAGTVNLTSTGLDDAFIAKYDVNGNYLWAKNLGSTGNEYGYKLAVNAIGDCFVTGYFEGTVDFDPSAGVANITSGGANAIFFAKYDANGNYIWAQGMGATGDYDTGSNIALDIEGNTYLTGRFTGTADFDPGAGIANLTSAGLMDIFIAKYDANGNYQYAKNIGSAGDDHARGIIVDNIGNSYITGFFRNTADFNPGAGVANLSSVGLTDIFFAKYANCNVSVSSTNVSCVGGSNGTATAIASLGTPPYTYSWTPGGSISANATGLAPGIYTVTVTDAASTTATATVNIAPAGGPNAWAQRANFGGGLRYKGISFSIGNKGYIGTGASATQNYTNDFWEYDPTTNVWTQKANVGGNPRQYAVGFSIGAKGYVGTGEDNTGNNTTDFYEYDPSLNIWTPKATFLGAQRARAIGFSIGAKGYLGTGINGGGATMMQDFWEYNPANNQWTQKANFGGGARDGATGFVIGDKGYVGTGRNTSLNYLRDFWEYNPITDTWLQKADVGALYRGFATGFSIGNKGFLGTGTSDGGTSSYNDFYEYNPSTDQWIQRANFIGTAVTWASGLAIGNKGYIGLGFDTGSTSHAEFYEYTSILNANITTQTNVNCNGASIGSATASPSGGNPPYSFSWNTTPAQTSATATNLVAGSYTCTVTDCDGSSATCTVVITQSGAPDSWTQKASFPGINRAYGVAFSIGNKGYYGTGTNTNGITEYNDFWEYDPVTNVWTQKANFGGVARKGATGFSIGSKGYLGIGHDNISGFHDDFWEYNPVTNSWIQKANFPPVKRYAAVGFSIGNKGYMGTGYENQSTGSFIWYNDFWEYDQSTDSWLQRTSVPGAGRSSSVGFSIGSKGYVGTGSTNNTAAGIVSDFYEFDPIANTWTPKANYGGGVINEAACFAIGGKGYIGTGSDGVVFKQDFWEYNPTTDIWVQKANFGGSARYNCKAFVIGTKGYFAKGVEGSYDQDLWEYNPSSPIVTASFTNSNVGQTFTFTNTTTNGVSYLWDFGDGTTSTLANPTHTYPNGGTYNVCLTATNECVSNQICSSITFGCSNPTAVFTSSVSGLTANFTNTSANATSYNWSFGDAISSTQQNPSHVYNASGTYTVTLTTTNGCGTATVTHTITVTCVAPTASYTFTVGGMTATFTNTSPNAANVTWNFSDPNSGANNSANTTNPSHVFSEPGLYNVTLYVNNACGVDSVTQAVLVNCALPVSDFVSNPNGLSVQLNGLASTNAYTHSWNFGDASSASIFPFDTHAYSTTGTYNVCLTTTNSCGTDTKCDSVTVCAAPIASFSSTANTTDVSFTNTSSQATNWFWNFGDGNASNLQNPTHQFASSGTKIICLTASNSCGSDTICNNLFLFCSSGLTPGICVATVDTTSSYNIIYWDKTGYATSDTFLVYRDTANNNYALIGWIAYDSLSEFNDTVRALYAANGDPNVSSWRYKLAVKDSCGNVSAMSPYHQTMFMQNNSGNFSWNHYQIEGQSTPVPSLTGYVCARDDNSTNNWAAIQSISASSIAYTDPQYATFVNTASWRINTAWNTACVSTRGAINTSRSNIRSPSSLVGIKSEDRNQISQIKVYPNPATDFITIEIMDLKTEASFEIQNMLGQVVYKVKTRQIKNTVNTAALQNGVYVLKTNIGGKVYSTKLIIQQ
ncbi:MAG: PKD domain-containing protein [Bacteroidota bacterium]|nr:PKD domain-containing protein [Bacteroidota bacterium]